MDTTYIELPLQFHHLLNEVSGLPPPLPDKPEESPRTILQALWLTAAGHPVSVKRSQELSLRELDAEASARLRDLLDKRKAGIPLAHLTQRQNFLGLELIAGPEALIPRQETEILGRAALSKLNEMVAERNDALVLDVCTGSGNLALAYAHHQPNCRVYGSDLSHQAIELAQRNREYTGLHSRVEFHQGDLFAPFESEAFLGRCDLISCNPPYISEQKVSAMPKEISGFEPSIAFNGGFFGVTILLKLIEQAPRFLKPVSWLCFEVGLGQGPALEKRLRASSAYAEVESWKNEAGEIRALSARTV